MGKPMTSITLLVPRQHVKRVKTVLEEKGALRGKITVEKDGDGDGDGDVKGMRMRIPTTLFPEDIPGWQQEEEEQELDEENPSTDIAASQSTLSSVLDSLGLSDLTSEPHTSFTLSPSPSPSTSPHQTRNKNPLLASLTTSLSSLPPSLLASLDLTIDSLVAQFPATYTVYKPLLLLPPNALSAPAWRTLLASVDAEGEVLGRVWEGLARGVGARCVAVNGGIPPTTMGASAQRMEREEGDEDEEQERKGDQEKEKREGIEEEENILRLPSTLHPLHGPFGPPPTHHRQHFPSPKDFSFALWVSCTQNGVFQTWAPRYTMFSRGNVKEKARVLGFAQDTVGGMKGMGCTAVDLYAGIGYFAFSYRKAGVSTVVCFEMNPWSVEGLRRGAEGNGWGVRIYCDTPSSLTSPSSSTSPSVSPASLPSSSSSDPEPPRSSPTNPDPQPQPPPHDHTHPTTYTSSAEREPSILVFPESNEHATSRLSSLSLRTHLPPICHVNCGFLPSSRLSWRTAIRLVDVRLGGWIHAHENVGVGDVESRRGEVEAEMAGYLGEWDGEREGVGDGGGTKRGRRRVECRHVERVKTYAPGVLHVVFDVWVEGEREAGEGEGC